MNAVKPALQAPSKKRGALTPTQERSLCVDAGVCPEVAAKTEQQQQQQQEVISEPAHAAARWFQLRQQYLTIAPSIPIMAPEPGAGFPDTSVQRDARSCNG